MVWGPVTAPTIKDPSKFDSAHLPAIYRLEKTCWIEHKKTLGEGYSGAGVYLVLVEDATGKLFFCVLKVGTATEIRNERDYCDKARAVLEDAVPTVYDYGTPGHSPLDFQAILLQLADDDPNFPPSLNDKIRDRSRDLPSCVGSIAELLVKWNAPDQVFKSARHETPTPHEFIDTLSRIGMDSPTSKSRLADLVERLQRGGIKGANLRRSMRVHFWEDGKRGSLPNPIYFATGGLHEEDICSSLILSPILGMVHGDLYGANILFSRTHTAAVPKLIDFAKGASDSPTFFDWMYLEFDLLYRLAPVDDEKTWIRWMRLITRVTQNGADEKVRPYQLDLEAGHDGIDDLTIQTIKALRTPLSAYWPADQSTFHHPLLLSFWLAGFYAGINFARKGIPENPASMKAGVRCRTTLKRYAALYYAACCLQRFFETSEKALDRMDDTPLIGPHKYLFMGIGQTPSQKVQRIYLESTRDDESMEAAVKFRNYYPVMASPDREDTPAETLFERITAARRFLYILGSAEDSDVRYKGFRIKRGAFACEAALAGDFDPDERSLLIRRPAEAQLEPSHPIRRELDSPNSQFKPDYYTTPSDLNALVKNKLLQWQRGKSERHPVNLSAVYPHLTWHGLGAAFKALPQASGVSVFTLKDVGNPEYQAMLWKWLEAQVKAQADPPLRYPPGLIASEDDNMARYFAFHLLRAWQQSKGREDYSGDIEVEPVTAFLLHEIVRALKKVHIFFLMPILNRRENELHAFCKMLEQAIAQSTEPIRYRVIFIVQEIPGQVLPMSSEALSPEKFAISGHDFESFMLEEEPDIYRFIGDGWRPDVPADWKAVFFGEQAHVNGANGKHGDDVHVSVLDFIRNFANFVNPPSA
ncbi:MAG: hypothetical protein U0670_08920 [Anaerolineae bacterium]